MSNTVRGGRFGKQLANSFGSAVRLLRGLTAHEAPTPSGPRGKGGTPVPAASSERFQKLRLAHKQLAQQVARLEEELERLHATITSNTRGQVGTVDAPGRNLNALMESARQLRERLQAKRLELVRMERNIARERQLLGHSVKPMPASEEPSVRTATAATTPQPRAKSPRALLAQRAIEAAMRQVPLDRTERALVAAIADGLLSDDEEVRRQAVTRLGERARPVVPLLVLATDDPDERVRVAALGALAGQRHPAVTKVFRRFLSDSSSALRLAALRGLASADEPNLTSGDLVATLGDGDAAVRRAAADVLGWHREGAKMSSPVIRALGFALYDDDVAVRVAAAEALGTAGDDRAVLALMRATGDAAEAVREAALRSVRLLVGSEVDTVIERATADKRTEALKLWWRTARVQLRGGSPPSSAAEIGTAARDVLRTLASLKGTTNASAVASAPVAPAPIAPAPLAAAPEAGAPLPAAPAVPVMPAPKAPLQDIPAAIGGRAGSTPAFSPEASIGKPGVVPVEAPAGAEFESALQESGEASNEDAEEYESILDDK